MNDLVVGLDQGTGSTKAIVIDETGAVVFKAARDATVTHPQPGHAEQDPGSILDSIIALLAEIEAFVNTEHLGRVPAAIGLSNQRESAIAWDPETGLPLSPLIGWQDVRTQPAAAELEARGDADTVASRTGLPLNPMFSALKFAAILDEIDPARDRSGKGKIRLGTVDSWLARNLTGVDAIEAGNASRTQLFSLETLDWDPELLEIFRVPSAALPPIWRSDADYGALADGPLAGVPIRAVLGDSHASLFGQGIRAPGIAKATMGTGSSIMAVQGSTWLGSGSVGSSTLAWLCDQPTYADEGNILSAGSTVEWCANLLDVSVDQLFSRAARAAGGVQLVPAFSGLGAPYWDPHAKAVLSGMSFDTTTDDVCLAAVDSIAHQVCDVVEAIETDRGRIDTLAVDGGASRNDWFSQRFADLTDRTVVRSEESNLSAVGAALLAGMSASVLEPGFIPGAHRFEPTGSQDWSRQERDRWVSGVARARLETL